MTLKGQSAGTLQTYTFAYNAENSPNRIRLTQANNGFGGKITYSYGEQTPVCDSTFCGTYAKRQAVTQSEVEDGVGNKITTVYCYGNFCAQSNAGADLQWGRVADSGEFLGYSRVETAYYAINSTSTLAKWEAADTWQGNTGDPDPRRGRLKRLEVRDLPTNTSGSKVLAVTENNWQAYRRHPSPDCTANANGWCTAAVNHQVFNGEYVTMWVRLEGTSAWADGVGKWTRQLYEYNRQNNNQFGNVTAVEELSHSEAALSLSTWQSRVSGNTGLSLLRTTVTEYFPNVSANIVNKPARVRVWDGPTCKAEMRMVYDNLGGDYNSAPTLGLVAKTQQAINACSDTATLGMYDGNWQETRLAYDGYGNQTTLHLVGSSASVGNQWYNTSYDTTYKRFATQQTQTPSGFAENAVYYGVNDGSLSGGAGVWGQMKEHCGVNGLCTQQSYDEFGRSQHRWERVADSTTALPSASSANVHWGYSNPGVYGSSHKTFIVTEWRAPRCYGNFTRTLYNGLGQVVTIKTPYQDWSHNVEGCGVNDVGQEIDVNYAYDALGNQSKASVPRLVTRGTFATHGTDLSIATTTVYDALGRPSTITAPNGEVSTYTYSGRSSGLYTRDRAKATNLADAYKMIKWQTLNGLGQLQNVYTGKWSGSAWSILAQENLTHNVLGHLTNVSHAASAGTTSMSYDLLGNKKTMTDVDLGGWSYAYDRQGNLTRQTDARGWTTCLYYDNLGRLGGKYNQPNNTTCPTAPAYHTTYGYDTNHSSSNRSRGQLTSISKSGYGKVLSYNGQGLLSQTTVTIPAAGANDANTTQYGYDSYQRPSTLTFPGGEVVTTSYNSMGLPHSLSSTQLGTIVDNASYDANGRLVQLRQALSGLWRNYLYAPWNQQNSNGGQLTGLWIGSSNNTATAAAYDRQKIDYSYDSFGNIVVLDEGFSSAFTYDAQNRLTNATSYDHNYNYTYDAAGRLTKYENVNYTVNNSFPAHAIKNSGFAYDNNGNMITRWVPSFNGSQTLAWNAENRLSSVSGAGTDTSYSYDADGQRVKAATAITSNYYPFANYEITVSGGVATTTKYYDFGGLRVAMRQNTNAPMYLYQNHLGSIIYATHDGGGAISDQRYFPYGRKRSGGTLPTDHRFTGQKHDDGSGLYYYNARYYDPELGTFISPDTLVPDPTELIDYNRYSYARGNPLKYNDPSGHCVFGGIDSLICILVGASLILGGDSTNTTYVPTEADIASSRIGGGLILAGAGGLLFTEARAGGMACAASEKCKQAIGIAEKAHSVAEHATNSGKTESVTDHIVLGLERFGLQQTAEKVGGRTLLSDPNWKGTLMQAIATPETKFTVSLDGLSGSSPYSQVMQAVQNGVKPDASPTNWELAQLYIANKLSEVTFVLGGKVIENPFVD